MVSRALSDTAVYMLLSFRDIQRQEPTFRGNILQPCSVQKNADNLEIQKGAERSEAPASEGGLWKGHFFSFSREKACVQILFLPTPDQPIGSSTTGKATERTMRNSNSVRGK